MTDNSRTGAPEGEFDPRAWITSDLTGEVTPVLKSDLHGLDEWAENWAVNPDLPSQVSFNAWQMSDDAHPVGAGKTGYRVVFKTIRTVVVPSLNFDLPNLRLSFLNSAITWGEPRFTNALPGRRDGEFLVPQWGKLDLQGPAPGYTAFLDRQVAIEAHQETTPDGNFVEILYQLPSPAGTAWAEQIAAGRAGIAPLTAALDLMFGERVIGPIITEEVGELFEDWHWNREIGGRTVAMEGQARLELLDASYVGKRVGEYLTRTLSLSDDDRGSLRIAAQWYWRADKDSDPVLAFLGYWLSVEALELGENASITPLKTSLAALLGVEQSRIAVGVNRMYQLRNKLAHGKLRQVDAERVGEVASLATALLESHALGTISPERLAELHRAVVDR